MFLSGESALPGATLLRVPLIYENLFQQADDDEKGWLNGNQFSLTLKVRPNGIIFRMKEMVSWMEVKEVRPVHHGNSQELGHNYWVSRSSVRLFARTAHSFACSKLLALLTCSAALICSLFRLLTHSRARGKVNDWVSRNDLVLPHSAVV